MDDMPSEIRRQIPKETARDAFTMSLGTQIRPLFADRTEAGHRVALLLARGFGDPVVYALPRGGVPVALPIVQALHALLDLLLVRKLGVPWQPELGFGAIAEGLEEPLLNQDIIAHTGLTEDMIAPVLASEKHELARWPDRATQAWRGVSGARRAHRRARNYRRISESGA